MYLYARRRIADEAVRQKLTEATADVEFYDDDDEAYLSRWSHSPDEEKAMCEAVIDLAGLRPLVGDESNHAEISKDRSTVKLCAAYWRKANAIHAWFVDHCQEGVDECQEAEVHPEQLAQLSAQCKDALAAYHAGDLTKAAEIMEPRQGFFFGGYEIDEWWAQDLSTTIDEIDRIVRATVAMRGGVEFLYQSSW
jgi:hypothetical protein